jgi:hypothetical protein
LPPYVDHQIIDQNYATGGPGENCVFEGETANSVFLAKNWERNDQGYDKNEVQVFRMANVAGPVSLFFDTETAPAKVTVYRGNAQFRTMDDAVNVSNSEVTALQDPDGEFDGWFAGMAMSELSESATNDDFYTGAGKISWTHDPSLGRTYTVIVAREQNNRLQDWRLAVRCPVDTVTVSCSTSPNTTPVPSEYRGIVEISVAQRHHHRHHHGLLFYQWTLATHGHWMRYCQDESSQALLVTCRGLKPNTLHSLYVEGQRITHGMPNDQPFLDPASTMVTDQWGEMRFNIYVPMKKLSYWEEVLAHSGIGFLANAIVNGLEAFGLYKGKYGSVNIKVEVNAPGSSASATRKVQYRQEEWYDVSW